jgi:serine/threonine protein kinase
MGVVCKAQDTRLKRLVAIKQMRIEARTSPQAVARFQAEAEAIARLHHPHPIQESMRLVMLLARAVHAAHQAGVIHRDLKPANVLLAPPADEPALNTHWGCPKISDFGLARLSEGSEQRGSRSGTVLGTPSCLAPEQAEGRLRDVGPATDVWALGVMLYELLTGRLPFTADTLMGTLRRICYEAPLPLRQLRPETPEAAEQVVLRCLRKRPQERYPSALALAEELKGTFPAPAGAPVFEERLNPFPVTPVPIRKKSPRGLVFWATTGGIATITLGLGLALGLWSLLPIRLTASTHPRLFPTHHCRRAWNPGRGTPRIWSPC